MKTRQLTLFHRMNCNGKPSASWLIAAWHWSWSLTWRWSITWSPRHSGKLGFYFMRVYLQKGFNFHCGWNLPFLGAISMQTQPNMLLNKKEEIK